MEFSLVFFFFRFGRTVFRGSRKRRKRADNETTLIDPLSESSGALSAAVNKYDKRGRLNKVMRDGAANETTECNNTKPFNASRPPPSPGLKSISHNVIFHLLYCASDCR